MSNHGITSPRTMAGVLGGVAILQAALGIVAGFFIGAQSTDADPAGASAAVNQWPLGIGVAVGSIVVAVMFAAGSVFFNWLAAYFESMQVDTEV